MHRVFRTAASLAGLAAITVTPTAAQAGCLGSFTDYERSSTCLGTEALKFNSGFSNSAVGAFALGDNTSGSFNTAIGESALRANTTGLENTASGQGALYSNTTGNDNSAVGTSALKFNTTGGNNSALGASALFANTTGSQNTASGESALQNNTTGANNTAGGQAALYANTTGEGNSAVGRGALYANTTGTGNTATGRQALYYSATGNNNTADGASAGLTLTGSNNTMIGAESGFDTSLGGLNRLTGDNNIALGYQAGAKWGTNNAAVSNNIAIGNAGIATDASTIRIGSTQNRTFIAGITTAKISKGQAVLIDANGQLGTKKSSIRYKEDVRAMGAASTPLMQLRPVTFRYKDAESDGSKSVQYGLIAEEVEKVMPELVVYTDKGTPDSVAYDQLPSLLLNEYQKQARELAATREDLAATRAELAAQRAQMEAEIATLKLAVGRLASAGSGTNFVATAP